MDSKYRIIRSIAGSVITSLLCLAVTSPASADNIKLERPGEREFVRDLAGMLDAESKERIQTVCDKLLTDKASPIIVVTIESMSAYGGANMRIETFAMMLFNQWAIGHEKLGGEYWNTGILLLISRDDRKARIELGDGWGRREDALCQKIMDERIVYHFKQKKFPEGIVAGVEALDLMARQLELPSRPRPWWHYVLVLVFIGLAVFTIVSLIRNGSSGWAWLFWAVIFTATGYFLYTILTSSGNSSNGGGFSGGSFGGGFSGGGGATGSW